jgi:hypothetical protein
VGSLKVRKELSIVEKRCDVALLSGLPEVSHLEDEISGGKEKSQEKVPGV